MNVFSPSSFSLGCSRFFDGDRKGTQGELSNFHTLSECYLLSNF